MNDLASAFATSPAGPDASGHWGRFGGRFIPEALIAALDELDRARVDALADPVFKNELDRMSREYAGLPSLLYDARRLSKIAGARILLKREDLNHTGAHKIRNVLGQALLTKRMGKSRVIAETGAGQHGVAAATAAAYLDLECLVYMGEEDTRRQALNVARMRMLGAEVVSVRSGSRTLKDAMNEALRDWVASVDHTHYVIGSAAGPHPFPAMVRDFCRGIGDEARAQSFELLSRLPDAVCACVGGGSNAIGMFTAFVPDESVRLYGFEAGGDGFETGRHAAAITAGKVGVLHGSRSFLLQDEDGQTTESHTISAGLDYPGVGPEHAWLHESGRATYAPVSDAEAMEAFRLLTRTEGIIPAIESAHAVAGALRVAKELGPERGHPGQPVRQGRQGRRHGGEVVRPARCRQGRRMSVTPVFDKARGEDRGVLVGCVPAGFPTYDGAIAMLRAMVEGGVDVVEVELPYSDPTIDGPAIQAASEQALRGGIRTSDVLRTIEAVAGSGVCTILMTYWNPIEQYGVERFARDFASAGGSALVTPDLIPEEAGEWIAASDATGVDRVFLVAPSSTEERIRRTVDACRGFVYATSVMGVTGARAQTSAAAPDLVARTRAATSLPVGVGLGVSNGDQAADVASYADAVIVGSAFVRRILDAPDEAAGANGVGALARDLAAGVRRRAR